ncbi:MAG: cell division protein FtsK, partial [Trueperella pyogenes]|nr:cell division protein FtsK [Trueperella pyogenes]
MGDFPLAPTLLQAALRSSWHFACVSGPNIGLVVSPLGRPQEFPAQIQIFTDNRGREHMSFLLDSEDAQIWIRPAAFIPWRRLRPKRVYTPAKGMQLKVSGSSASDYYQLRQRPRDLSFPSASRTSRHLPTMPFIGIVPLLLFMVLRMLVMGSYGGMSLLLFVVPLISMSILGIVVMKRGKPRHRIDAAWLALLLETAVPSISESSSLLVYPNHIGRGKALTVSGTDGETYLGFVGPEAKLSALWCAAQLAAQLGGARVAEGTDELIDIGRQKSLGPGAANSRSCRASIRLHAPGEDENGDENIHLAWAHHFNELPTWCHTVIPASRAPVSLAWWKMLGRDTLFGSIPECVDFDELPFEVIDSDEGLRTPIGKDNSGVVHIDLVKHGPHALIAGTTGSGKSEALRTWLLGLCESYSPSRLRLVLVDYKGGSALTPLTALPHTETVLTDLNLAHSSRALRGLASCIATREAQFAQYAVKDLSQWHER